jgi:hypothetical protein
MHRFVAFLLLSASLLVQAADLPELRGAPQSGPEPILLLGEHNQPLAEPIRHEIRMDYYECNGLVGGWFQELISAEMRYLEAQSKLRKAAYDVCIVGASNDNNLKQGKYVIYFYENLNQRNNCILKKRCNAIRNVTLVPKNNGIYRSYFLSDLKDDSYQQFCVTSKGKLYPKTTCFMVDSDQPDNR